MKQALVIAAVLLAGCASSQVSPEHATGAHCQISVSAVTKQDGSTVSHSPERCIAWTFGPTAYENQMRKGNWLMGKKARWDR